MQPLHSNFPLRNFIFDFLLVLSTQIANYELFLSKFSETLCFLQ